MPINGTEGNNNLHDTTGDDVINALGGDDVITVTEGMDDVRGGPGADTLYINWFALTTSVSNLVPLGLNAIDGGFDGAFSGGARRVDFTSIEHFVIFTGSGNDNITTGEGDDRIVTGNGDDVANGGAGDDSLEVGTGLDQANGGSGTDTLVLDYTASTTSVFSSLSVNGHGGYDGSVDDGSGLRKVDFTGIEQFTIAAGSGSDNITTGDGTDFIYTMSGNDIVNSGGGDDRIDVGTGLDHANGGSGNDTLVADLSGSTNAVISGGPNFNPVDGGFDGFYTDNSGLRRVDYTSIDNVVLFTGSGNDVIATATGSDFVQLGSGNDFVNFGTGDDSGDGGPGEDGLSADLSSVGANISIYLQPANPNARFTGFEYLGTLTTGGGNDIVVTRDLDRNETINLGGGDDSAWVENGVDVVNGGTGSDTLIVNFSSASTVIFDDGPPALNGGGGYDGIFRTGPTRSVSYTSIERFEIYGSIYGDVIRTAGGDDVLDGGGSNDTMIGGAGDDQYYVDSAGDLLVEGALEGGGDVVYASVSYVLTNSIRIETMVAYVSGAAAIDLTGNDFANTIIGSDGINILIGGGGDDNIQGGGGNDQLTGGAGADTLDGAAGDDTYLVDAADIMIEGVGQGSDTVYSAVNFALAPGVEVETLSVNDLNATIAINLTGNEFGQSIIGNAGDNFLVAGGGADALYGGLGNDSYSVDTLDVVFDSGGNDIIYSSTNYQLNAGSAIETLSTNDGAATVALNLTGNEFGQSIIGNAGANFLIAGAGADGLYGGLGDDTYSVDTLDVVVDSGGFDIIYSSTNFQLNLGSQIEILSANDAAATTPLNLTGNEFGQQIFGNAGDNFLIAGAGADGLYGKGGNDTYSIDSQDVVVENAGEGYDTIYTSTGFILTAGNEVEVISVNDLAATTGINLTGNEFGQQIIGNAGANVLNGGAGSDSLAGNAGADTFAFTTALGATNVDNILDFVSGTDKVALDHNIFGLGIGALTAGAFVTGTAAADADDRIIYNAATGQLFYDADGNGASAQVLFATLNGHPAIAASDFQVF